MGSCDREWFQKEILDFNLKDKQHWINRTEEIYKIWINLEAYWWAFRTELVIVAKYFNPTISLNHIQLVFISLRCIYKFLVGIFFQHLQVIQLITAIFFIFSLHYWWMLKLSSLWNTNLSFTSEVADMLTILMLFIWMW